MKKIAATFALVTILLASFAAAADSYKDGRIVKWENGTYAQGKQSKNWIIYQLQTDSSIYSIARQKETKPKMEAGETVRYEIKKGNNKVTVINAKGKKNDYQIVGQSAATGQ